MNKFDVSDFKNKTILITGANGLIGSTLAEYLCDINDKNNLNIKLILTSLSEIGSLSEINNLLSKNYVEYISHDFSHPLQLSKVLANTRHNISNSLDYVFYCAGYGQPKKFNENFEATCFVNTVGLNSILKLVKNTDCTVCYMSSSEIYGESGSSIKESNMGKYSVENNRSIYITSKRLGESIMLKYKDFIDIKIMRVSLAYGSRMKWTDDRVMQDFIRKSQKGIIDMYDDGTDVRYYNYIDNCIEMILNTTLNGKEYIYNIANNMEQTTIYELAKSVQSIFNPNCKVVRGGKKKSNSPDIVSMNIDRYVKEFGQPKFLTLSDGLKLIKKNFERRGLI